MRQILERINKILKRSEKKPGRLEGNSENEAFLQAAGEQLKILARKGLSIQVFTL